MGDSGAVTALDWAQDAPVEVPMTTLDDVAADTLDIALQKIDVQSSESHGLRGARMTLAHTQNVVIEINRPALLKAGTAPEELFDLLRSAGLRNLSEVTQTGMRRLLSKDVTNFLATR